MCSGTFSFTIADNIAVGKVAEGEKRPHFLKKQDDALLLMGSSILHSPTVIPSELYAEYRAHSVWNHRWQRITAQLHKSLIQKRASITDTSGSSTPGSTESTGSINGSSTISLEIAALAVLITQVKSSLICLAGAFSPLETVYDSFNPVFDDIVSLAEDIYPSIAAGYHFELGIIPPLHITAMKCRDRKIRRRAIVLLAAVPMKEGVFDSHCCSLIAEWCMGVEEDGVETEIIPEHRRLTTKESSLDLPGRKVYLQATNRKTAEDTELQWHEMLLTWRDKLWRKDTALNPSLMDSICETASQISPLYTADSGCSIVTLNLSCHTL